MKSFVLEPGVGVGPVPLGTSRADVIRALGPEYRSFLKVQSARYQTDGWFFCAFQVFYAGEAPSVEFIELSRGREIEAQVMDIPVFGTPAREVVFHLKQATACVEEEAGGTYIF